jgi:hypothetical protein
MTHTHLVWGVVGKDLGKFYSDMECRAWLVLKNVGRVRILNLHERSIVVNEGLRFVNVRLARVQLACTWNTWLHLSVITSNKENSQRCIWMWFCLSIFVSLTSIIIELMSSSFSFAKMVKEERKLRSKLDLEFPP